MKDEIVFNGVVFKLVSNGRYYLSQSRNNVGRKNAKGLHVAIWEFYNQKEVPKGWIVHHKDGDHANNHPSNLECISKEQHHAEHRQSRIAFGKSPQHTAHLKKIRKLAAKWHQSPEGRRWHSEQAYRNVDKIFKLRNLRCTECNTKFQTRKPSRTFVCGSVCAYKRRERMRPLITTECVVCRQNFVTKARSAKTTKTCSGPCKRRLGMKNK